MKLAKEIYDLYLKIYGKDGLDKIISTCGEKLEALSPEPICVVNGVRYICKNTKPNRKQRRTKC